MLEIHLPVNCDVSPWATDERYTLPHPVYRLYCNEDLLTERTWAWGPTTFISEEIYLKLDCPTRLHFRLEPLLTDPKQATFYLGQIGANKHIHYVKVEQLDLIVELH